MLLADFFPSWSCEKPSLPGANNMIYGHIISCTNIQRHKSEATSTLCYASHWKKEPPWSTLFPPQCKWIFWSYPSEIILLDQLWKISYCYISRKKVCSWCIYRFTSVSGFKACLMKQQLYISKCTLSWTFFMAKKIYRSFLNQHLL